MKIKKKIDEYLEFDSDELFGSTDYLEIFGGSVRDCIADLEIHDIDILALRNSALSASQVLIKNEYQNVSEKLTTKEIHSMYKDVHCIFEPWTFMNKNLKIVQIIRPCLQDSFNRLNIKNELIDNFFQTMKEVDLSCCGLSYDGKRVKENCTDAAIHAYAKVFIKNNHCKMYDDRRTFDRILKLEDRGWKNISDMSVYNYGKWKRKIKINKLNEVS